MLGTNHDLCQQSGYPELSLSLSRLQDTMGQSGSQLPAKASLQAVSHLLCEPHSAQTQALNPLSVKT